MTTRGSVYPYGPPCPRCGGDWESIKDPVTGDTSNILCKECFTMPVRFAIDGRAFKNRRGNVGRLFRDERGELFYHFQGAKRVLESIRHTWDQEGQERFNPTKYSKLGRESCRLSECAREWILYLAEKGRQGKHGGSTGYRSGAERAFRLHINPFKLDDGRTLGDIDIREICADDIEKLSLSMSKDMAEVSVEAALTKLMTLFKRYRDRKNVLVTIPPFPEGWSEVPDTPRRVINGADQRVLICRMAKYHEDRADRRTIILLLKTQAALGCRPSEACAFKRKDLLDDGRMMIQGAIEACSGDWKETKTGRRRISDPLPEKLAQELRGLPVLPRGFLFAIDGKPINPNRLSWWFGQVRGEAYTDVTLNTFARHSMASTVARSYREEGIREAARVLGNTVSIAKRAYVMEG